MVRCGTLVIGLWPAVSRLRPYQNGVGPRLNIEWLARPSTCPEQSAVEKVIHISYTKLIGMTKARLPSACILDRVL